MRLLMVYMGFELVQMQPLRFIMFNNCPLYENITDLPHIKDLKVAYRNWS